MKRVVVETAVVLGAGMIFALLANVVSPRGLELRRNYFPGSQAVTNANTNAHVLIEARLKAKGLTLADSNQVIQLFRDPRYEVELVIFVDARDDRHYQEGHVPAAYQLDHYRPADYLAPVLAASQNAEKIVVYCNGGNCEDSEFAAITLRDIGVAGAKLLIYGGGMLEWVTNGLPVELGARRSGRFKENPK